MPTTTERNRTRFSAREREVFFRVLGNPANQVRDPLFLSPGTTWIMSTGDGAPYGVYQSISNMSWYGGALDENLRPLRRLNPKGRESLWHGHWTDEGVEIAQELALQAMRDAEV